MTALLPACCYTLSYECVAVSVHALGTVGFEGLKDRPRYFVTFGVFAFWIRYQEKRHFLLPLLNQDADRSLVPPNDIAQRVRAALGSSVAAVQKFRQSGFPISSWTGCILLQRS